MDERILLLLGLLKNQSQHGYQMFEFIDHVLGQVPEMKKATAYALLKKLLKDGYIDVKSEQSGKRPVKQVYSITEKGETYFLEILKNRLESYENITPNSEISLMFVDYLPKEEVILLFEKKIKKVESLLQMYSLELSHPGIGVTLSMDHRKNILQSEYEWYKKNLKKIKKLDWDVTKDIHEKQMFQKK